MCSSKKGAEFDFEKIVGGIIPACLLLVVSSIFWWKLTTNYILIAKKKLSKNPQKYASGTGLKISNTNVFEVEEEHSLFQSKNTIVKNIRTTF